MEIRAFNTVREDQPRSSSGLIWFDQLHLLILQHMFWLIGYIWFL